MTTAQRISKLFNDNNFKMYTSEGVAIDNVCNACGERIISKNKWTEIRYRFEDGSSISIRMESWRIIL